MRLAAQARRRRSALAALALEALRPPPPQGGLARGAAYHTARLLFIAWPAWARHAQRLQRAARLLEIALLMSNDTALRRRLALWREHANECIEGQLMRQLADRWGVRQQARRGVRGWRGWLDERTDEHARLPAALDLWERYLALRAVRALAQHAAWVRLLERSVATADAASRREVWLSWGEARAEARRMCSASRCAVTPITAVTLGIQVCR